MKRGTDQLAPGCELNGIKAHLLKNVFTPLKDWVCFMILPHASRVMVFWSEPSFKTSRSGGGKRIGKNICRLCIRDQDDGLLPTSDMGAAPWFSGAKWRSPREGSVWSIKNMANCRNLIEQMNED
jgi:hypothetical protein